MFKNASDRAPVFFVLALSLIDFLVYFLVNEVWWLAGYTLLMLMPKGLICAWNHHHQHTLTFRAKPPARIFLRTAHRGDHKFVGFAPCARPPQEFSGPGAGRKSLEADGRKHDGALEYTLIVAGTAYYRGFQVGGKHPRAQRKFLLYSAITFAGVALLCWFRTVPAIFVFLLPMIISLMFTAWVTYDHHNGLDTDVAFHASYNNCNRLFNLLTGNLGYTRRIITGRACTGRSCRNCMKV